MPFERPSLSELIERARLDIEAVGLDLVSRVRLSFEDAFARMVAGVAHGLHGHIAWATAQILPDKASMPFVRRWGNMLGLSPRPANEATGVVRFTRTAASGAVPAEGAVYRFSDGTEYSILYPLFNSASTTIDANVVAVVGGAAGNRDAGDELAAVVAVVDLDSPAIVQAPGLERGIGAETDEQYRARVVRKLANLGDAGAPGDFVNWALEIPGVLKAWEEVTGAGEVEVAFVDGDYETGEYVFPDVARVAVVDAYLESVCPITIDVIAVAPVAEAVNYTLSVTPDTAEVRAAVEAELTALHAREGAPGVTLPISRIREAISAAEGETDHVLASPAANVVPSAPANILTRGTVTFT